MEIGRLREITFRSVREGTGKSADLKLNAKILSFNVDPDFSDCIDGLIVKDLTQTKPRLLRRFIGTEGFSTFSQNRELNQEAFCIFVVAIVLPPRYFIIFSITAVSFRTRVCPRPLVVFRVI
jgi:hypothetical protein